MGAAEPNSGFLKTNAGDGAFATPNVPVVGAQSAVLDVTLTLDTSAYASGDLIAETQEVANAVTFTGGTAVLQSLTITDEDDQGVALYVVFLKTNVTMGSENSAPSISDANSREILGWVPVATTDYLDVGGAKIACVKNLGLVLQAATGATSVYVAVVNSTGTPTYTASGLKLKIGVLQD